MVRVDGQCRRLSEERRCSRSWTLFFVCIEHLSSRPSTYAEALKVGCLHSHDMDQWFPSRPFDLGSPNLKFRLSFKMPNRWVFHSNLIGRSDTNKVSTSPADQYLSSWPAFSNFCIAVFASEASGTLDLFCLILWTFLGSRRKWSLKFSTRTLFNSFTDYDHCVHCEKKRHRTSASRFVVFLDQQKLRWLQNNLRVNTFITS